MANVVDSAVSWAVSIANNPACGYSRTYRQGPDYDCSSLVINAYEQAGLKVKAAGAISTANMVNAFLKCGFKDVTSSVNLVSGAGLIKGDVLWKSGHTGIMVDSTKIVEAMGNYDGVTGDSSGREILVQAFSKSANRATNYWKKCLRYKTNGTESGEYIDKSEVVSKNAYLSLDEMRINAQYILNYLVSRGWSKNAVCALLGNMETESTINPGIWQGLNEFNTSGGFGLVQWTPATKLIEWSTEQNLYYIDIDTQLKRLIWEVENGGQWYATDSYNLSFSDFITSNESVEYLAKAFLYNYERPASYDTADARAEQAARWYSLLNVGSNSSGDWFDDPDEDFKGRKFNKLLIYALAADEYF